MNIKRLSYVLFIFLILWPILFFFSCSKQQIEKQGIDFGYDYYPLAIGKSWIYQVDSIVYQPGLRGISKDSSRSFLREVIVDTTTSIAGEVQYIIERYYRPNENSSWQIDKVFTRSRSKEYAFLTEDNLRFIKMPFPLAQGKRWDGNLYFDHNRLFPVGGEMLAIYAEWSYTISGMNENTTIAGKEYPEVLTIQQANYTEDLYKLRIAQEKYARDIGLLFRECFIADTQCRFCCPGSQESACRNLPWEGRAEKGFHLKQILLSYN